jgi:hypothetical protein
MWTSGNQLIFARLGGSAMSAWEKIRVLMRSKVADWLVSYSQESDYVNFPYPS